MSGDKRPELSGSSKRKTFKCVIEVLLFQHLVFAASTGSVRSDLRYFTKSDFRARTASAASADSQFSRSDADFRGENEGAGIKGDKNVAEGKPEEKSVASSKIQGELWNLRDSARGSESKSGVNLEQIGLQLEGLELRLTRLDAAFQLRAEKIITSITNREVKEELSFDQLSRKFDAHYERLNYKIGILESAQVRLEKSIENILNKIELQDRKIKEELINISVRLNETSQRNLDTRNILMQSLRNTSSNQHEKLQRTIKSLEEKIDSSRVMAWGIQADRAKDEQLATQENEETTNAMAALHKKVSHLYHDFKLHSENVENLLRESMTITNIIKRKILLLGNESSQGYLEEKLEAIPSTVKRKVNELSQIIEDEHQQLMNVQKSFLESCHRIQEDESQVEQRISLVLEKILDHFDNRSTKVDLQFENLLTVIKTQGDYIRKNIAHTNSLVVQLDENVKGKDKRIEDAASLVQNGDRAINTSIKELQGRIELLLNQTENLKAEAKIVNNQCPSQEILCGEKTDFERKLWISENEEESETEEESDEQADSTSKTLEAEESPHESNDESKMMESNSDS